MTAVRTPPLTGTALPCARTHRCSRRRPRTPHRPTVRIPVTATCGSPVPSSWTRRAHLHVRPHTIFTSRSSGTSAARTSSCTSPSQATRAPPGPGTWFTTSAPTTPRTSSRSSRWTPAETSTTPGRRPGASCPAHRRTKARRTSTTRTRLALVWKAHGCHRSTSPRRPATRRCSPGWWRAAPDRWTS